MKKMKRIDQQKETLEEKEKKILLELEHNEKQLRSKAKSIGKIALVTGFVALIAYWGFKLFVNEPEEPKKSKKKKKTKNSSMLSQIATPFLVKFFSELLDFESKDSSVSESTKD